MRADSSFVAQRFDRIERSCPISRVETEANPDGRADEHASDRPTVRKNQFRLQPGCEHIADDYSQNNSQNAAGFGNENCFGQELPANVAAASSDGFSDANRFAPCGKADKHDIHDANDRRYKRDTADDKRAETHHSPPPYKCTLERGM